MDGEQRFRGALSDQYRLVEKAYPHFHRLQEAVGRAVAEHAGPLERATVLELGCGDGITSDVILRAAANVHLTAIDNEPKMVKLAQEHLERYVQAGRLEILCADALAYLDACEEGRFDILAGALTFHNLERDYRASVLAASFRALKPGGLFVNADKYAPDGQARFDALGEQLGRFFDTFLPMEEYDLLKEWVLHNVEDQSPKRAMPADEAAAQMRTLGFIDVDVSGRENMEAVLTARKAD